MCTERPGVDLPENQVDIWCARLPEDEETGLFGFYRETLTTEEIGRFTRFSFENDRRQFLMTRALQRDVLSRYLGVDPATLVFMRDKYGKPALEEPKGCPISFSLSHTKGLSVCAVVSDQMIGVDVECLERSPAHRDIAKRFFAASEAAFLESVDEDQQRTEFLRLWTLKEAFVKARGLGLSIPLNSFELTIFPDRPPEVSYLDGRYAKKTDWGFFQICLGSSFHIAIALEMSKKVDRAVTVSTITPFTDERSSIILEPNPLNVWEIEEI